MLLEILTLIITIIVSVVVYTARAYKYWERKKVPYLEPSFPFGNLRNPFTTKIYIGEFFKNIYFDFKRRGFRNGGIYTHLSPMYFAMDPQLLKHIMQKDFQYFVDRGFYYNEKDDPLSAHLFAIGGQKWRHLRTKLTPTFTSGKMKMMFSILLQCAKQMEEAMETYSETNEPINIREIVSCFTTDVIGSCAFGLDCNCFKNPNTEFRKYGRKIFEFSQRDALKLSFAFFNEEMSRKLGFTFFPRDATNFFMNVVEETVKYRKTNNVIRKDMLQLLIDMQNEDIIKNEQNPLTMEEMAAQAFVFFAAGFETSSTTISFCLYELAEHSHIQEKVREEIKEILSKYNGQITYDGIMEMKYMDQVIEETLRKYPPLSYLTRDCVKDYQIPNTDIILEKGTKVMISTLGLHRDAEYFPEPDKFDPERFSDDNRQNITPFAYIPFGEGPRLCIGMRFGLMQTKVGLITLLKDYSYSINKKTELPFVWNYLSFTMAPNGGIWLDRKRIN